MQEEPIISVRNIVNRFGTHTVHDGVSIDIYESEILGLVGGSGSGKSVLMRTIIGLQEPTEGNVTIKGLEARQHGKYSLPWCGVLFQRGALFSSLNLLENIMAPLKEHTDLPDDICAGIARLKIALVGLPPEAETKYPSELSGGMVKRASLARALALDPPVLFLDEPTAGLDPIAADAFDNLIQQLQKSLKLTVIIITHDLDTLFSICTRIAVLVDKKIVVDTLDNLRGLEHPWIQEYFHGPRARSAWVGHHALEQEQHGA